MTDVEQLVYVAVAYMRAVYIPTTEHNLNDIINIVEKVSGLFSGVDHAIKHLAVADLWGSMVPNDGEERRLKP